MPDVDNLAELIALAHAGDGSAFTRLLARSEGGWRLIAATFCGSQGQIDAVLRCVAVVLRNALGECPTTAAGYGTWSEDLLLRLTERLLTLAQRPASGDDALTRAAAAKGLDALHRDPAAALAAARGFSARLAALTQEERTLLEQRYVAKRVDADALPALLGLRARLVDAAPPPPGQEAAWENALASSNRAVRDAAAAAAAGDDTSAQALACQLRAHLLLGALLTPLDPTHTQQLSNTVGFTPETAYPEATRASTQDGGSQLTAQVTFSIQEQPARRMTSRAGRPPTRSQSRRPPESVAVPMDPATSDGAIGGGGGGGGGDDDFDRSQRTTNYLMWGAIAIIVVAATIAILWLGQSSSTPAGPQVKVKEAAVGIGTVVVVEGQAQEILLDRSRRAAQNGAVLLPGEGMAVGDGSSFVTLRLEGLGQVTARAETLIQSIVTDPTDPQATLINLITGTLDIDASKPKSNARLSVNTNSGSMVSSGFKGEVRVANEVLTVSVNEGEARMFGVDDRRQVALTAGMKATANEHGRALLEMPRRFMRGINLGGEATAVAGQPWLSQATAQQYGLSIQAGQVQRGGSSATARLDPPFRSMLETGLAGDNGMVALSQQLPAALWEVELWLANDGGNAGQGVSVLIDGEKVPIGQPLSKGSVWKAIGPLGSVVHGDHLELRLSGLAPGDRLAGVCFRLLGPQPGDLGPAFASAPPPAADRGGLLEQCWDHLKGSGLASLENDPRFPQDAVHEAIVTSGCIPPAQEPWSGHRLAGFLHAPISGDYVFYLEADGTAELLLSGDELHFNARRIAFVPRSVSPDEWTKNKSQVSAPIRLLAGERYAIEALHRQSDKTTHLGIAWRLPDGRDERPIPGSCLSPLRPAR